VPIEEFNIERFEGVNQAFKDLVLPPGGVRWSYGLIDDEDVLTRVGGKLCLPSSMKPFTQVIDLHHLRFEDDEFVLVHHSSSRELFDTEDLDADTESPDGILEYGVT
jgi:hypothetical protein